ncbi:hypothetical protein [Natrarchaeobius oligotrophus]|uniref:Uncharacterized protein n=1 Tax=Natrarchaeobius chitinivorans TaxID=1679083 RepID=A0A3N6LZ90_NATCH|nr:hypothetical protein [Natrarchaeobius chitinivorans]RQG94487.1 hypothetical protein EA472_22330 [Natrarchaeobius chitinivorans]
MASIPEYIRRTLQDQIENHARTAWNERCARVQVRFRGEYAYIDAFESNPWMMPDASEEEKERIRHTPTKLCRLTWTGDLDSWAFAFYKYSDERYEPSITLDGSFTGSPESCFDTAAQAYLR